MKKFTKLQLIKYFLLQNRYSWSSLNNQQKNIIMEANIYHNNDREDYKNPELYQNGLGFNSDVSRDTLYRGRISKKILKKYNNNSVLEIGPGSGFITKIILDSKPLKYTAIDIVKPFLDYIKNSINQSKYKDMNCNFICSDLFKMKKNEKYDLIFFLSSLHHIPNREDFLNALIRFCDKDSVIILVEPTHYILRILKLLRKLPLYISKKYVEYDRFRNLSTHHFLTLNEYQSFEKFDIVEYGFSYPKKVPKLFYNRYFSNEIYVVLKPKSI